MDTTEPCNAFYTVVPSRYGGHWLEHSCSSQTMHLHSADFLGTMIYYLMPDENRAETCFMGSDSQASHTPALPPQRTANMAHLAGGGTPAQASAAADAFFEDCFLGAGTADAISVCLDEYPKYVAPTQAHELEQCCFVFSRVFSPSFRALPWVG